MRITEFERDTIKKLAHQYFGESASVWLFGSRADDSKLGGDIDLFLQTGKEKVSLDDQMSFLVALKLAIGDQKIDLVVESLRKDKKLPIYEHAKKTGILL